MPVSLANRATSRYVFRFTLCAIILLTLITARPAVFHAQTDKEIPALESGKHIERELRGDAAHSYRVTLAANQSLHVVVEPKGIDVVALQDKSRAAAEQALAEGERLLAEGSADSRRKAITKYQQALPLWRAVGDRAKEAFTLNYIGLVYYLLGERHKALDFYNQALPISRAVGDRTGEADALSSIGLIYSAFGEKQKALDYLNQSLLLNRAIGYRSGEAITLSNIGLIYESVGERQKALDFYNQSLPPTREVGDRAGEAVTLNNIGSVNNVLGEKQKALDFYNQALSLSRAVGDRNNEAVTLNNIGFVYHLLGDQQKAFTFYNQSLLLRRETGDRSGEAKTLNNIGWVYDSLGEWQKALDFYNKSLPLSRAVGDRSGEAHTLNNIGLIYDALGERQKSLNFYNQSLPLSRAVNDRSGEAYTLNNIGLIYGALGEWQKALDFYNQALPLERAVGDRAGEVATLANIARAERDRGNLLVARARIEEALTIIESLRTKIASQELRSSYFATVQKYYDIYIDLLMRLHQKQPSAGLDGMALQASERGRARSLLETLAEANADISQGVDPALVTRERSLQQQLNARAQEQMRLLNGQHTDAQAETIAKEIERLTTEFQQIQTQIRQTSPRYAALTQPQPLTLREIQREVLDRDTLLLEYSLGDERSYLWAVTPDSITSYELPKRSEIEDAARQSYGVLTGSTGQMGTVTAANDKTSAEPSPADAVERLSRMLLAPVAARLGTKRLLIVSDGALAYIPFAALALPVAGGKASAYQPLISEHEIVSLPSASTIAVLRREVAGRQPATKTVAVIADPVFDSNDARLDTVTKVSAAIPAAVTPGVDVTLTRAARESGFGEVREGFQRLPATRREAEAIMSLVPAANRKQVLDFAASRQTATSPDLGEYQYVHFATHGLLNSVHPELSGIVFTMYDERGVPQDGFLRAHEIFNLKLSADLVVLSACQTGLGKEVRGEGLVGLTRGFMYAGSPRVVVSLWSVSDRATSELMRRFYSKMLRDGMRPAAALQAAQIEMWKQPRWEAPFYWAAFTLQGEWRK